MESYITINGSVIKLKINAYAVIVYKSNFNSDLIEDLIKFIDDYNSYIDLINSSIDNNITLYNFINNNFNELNVFKIIWTYIKVLNKDLPPFELWLNTVETPFIEIFFQETFLTIMLYNLRKSKIDEVSLDNGNTFINSNTDDLSENGVFDTDNFLQTLKQIEIDMNLLNDMTIGNCLDYIDSYIEYKNKLDEYTKDENKRKELITKGEDIDDLFNWR